MENLPVRDAGLGQGAKDTAITDSNMNRYSILSRRLLIPTLFAWLPASTFSQPDADPTAWTKNDQMLAYYEALHQVETLYPAEKTINTLVKDSLTHLLDNLDPYCAYLPASDYQAYRDAQRPGYAGVGMELNYVADGDRVLCMPYPDSPAAQAGITDGAVLLRVDSQAVQDLSLMEIAGRIRGPIESSVTLDIETKGEVISVPLIRSDIRKKTAYLSQFQGRSWLRIFSFSNDTAGELKQALRELPESSELFLDLRGNPGGALFGAMDAARLFLPEGATLGTLVTNEGTNTYVCTKSGPLPEMILYLIQDEFTASAAEFFCAALIENQRALAVGHRTLGKGVTQRVVELTDGSAIVLTDGAMRTPEGHLVQGIGVEPHVPIEGSTSSLQTCIAAVDLVVQREKARRRAEEAPPE